MLPYWMWNIAGFAVLVGYCLVFRFMKLWLMEACRVIT